MPEQDLFYSEKAALQSALEVYADEDLPPEAYRSALGQLSRQYERMLREGRRLIHRSDRAEKEMNDLNAKLNDLAEQLAYKARHDALTGLLNRRAILDVAKQYQQNDLLSLIIVDIDFFKRINDEFGHPAGDTVIRGVAQRLQSVLGNKGHLGRIGGEEFVAVLANRHFREISYLADQMREAIAEHPFPAVPYPVTISLGVSHAGCFKSFEDAYAKADLALYEAKRSGRNRVVKHYLELCGA